MCRAGIEASAPKELPSRQASGRVILTPEMLAFMPWASNGRGAGPRHGEARLSEDRLLPVQRLVVAVLGDRHVGHQAGGGPPLVAVRGLLLQRRAMRCRTKA